MWFFKRNKGSQQGGPTCPHCGSAHTVVVLSPDSPDSAEIRTWRGQRYAVCHCRNCGRDFYTEPPSKGDRPLPKDDRMIEDEEELRAAEEELKRLTDEGGDRRYKAGGF